MVQFLVHHPNVRNYTFGFLSIKDVKGLIEKDGEEKKERGIGRGGARALFEKPFGETRLEMISQTGKAFHLDEMKKGDG